MPPRTVVHEYVKHYYGHRPHRPLGQLVAIGCDEQELDEIEVRDTCQRTARRLAWAEPLGPRTWAVESAGGLGYLLSQELVEAGEHVLDVPATLASRVRVLGTGHSNENDPNDARSVATAALRSPGLRSVAAGRPWWGAPSAAQAEPRDREAAQHRRVPPFTLLCSTSHQVESPSNSMLLAPIGCSGTSTRLPRCSRFAMTWPWSSSTM